MQQSCNASLRRVKLPKRSSPNPGRIRILHFQEVARVQPSAVARRFRAPVEVQDAALLQGSCKASKQAEAQRSPTGDQESQTGPIWSSCGQHSTADEESDNPFPTHLSRPGSLVGPTRLSDALRPLVTRPYLRCEGGASPGEQGPRRDESLCGGRRFCRSPSAAFRYLPERPRD